MSAAAETSHEGVIWAAVPGDRHHFVELWKAYLEEAREGGSSLHADDHNLRVFRGYFDSYTRGDLPGAVLFWSARPGDSPSAVLMWGKNAGEPIWHDDHNGVANMWGIYVAPEHRSEGVALRLCAHAVPLGPDFGFTGASTVVRVDNPLGLAFRDTLEKIANIKQVTVDFVGYWGKEE